LVSAGANALTINVPDGSFGNLQPGFTGGVDVISAGTSFSATTPKFTFDTASDNVVSVLNTTADDGRGRKLFLDPSVTSSGYDAASRTIHVVYFMSNKGRPDMKIDATFKYLAARE
jgi:hypothetical protein